MSALNSLDARVQCMASDAKGFHAEIDALKEKLGPLLVESEQRKELLTWKQEYGRQKKLLYASVAGAVVSSIIAGVVLAFFGLQ